MVSKIVKGAIIGSAIGAVVIAAECGMSKNGKKMGKMGKKIMKAIGLYLKRKRGMTCARTIF